MANLGEGTVFCLRRQRSHVRIVSGAPNLPKSTARAKAELVKGRSCRRFFIDRAYRIADSLQIGLNIEPKALRFPSASTFPA